ncbi:MAG: hypothetical protein WDN28_18925 [Chthoniobacter sp.]
MVAAHTPLPVLGGAGGEQGLARHGFAAVDRANAGGEFRSARWPSAKRGAKNAGLLAISILALQDVELRKALDRFREHQTSSVLAARLP